MSRILGVDYGDKRVGIAISDPLQIIATPLDYIPNNNELMEKFREILSSFQIIKIVVGIPLNLKGESGFKSKQVKEFINKLKSITGVQIIEWDERFTTKIAQQTKLDMGLKKKQRQDKTKIDSMAAAILLQNYLDYNSNKKNV